MLNRLISIIVNLNFKFIGLRNIKYFVHLETNVFNKGFRQCTIVNSIGVGPFMRKGWVLEHAMKVALLPPMHEILSMELLGLRRLLK